MQMNGINELITIAKYWERWADPRLIVLVLNNRDLNQVTWEQRAMEGDPKFEGSQELPDFPYARYAEMLGLHGIRVDEPDEVGAAWDEALAGRPPVVLRGGHRPRGAAAAAAHHARAGQGAHVRAAEGRPERRADHQAVVQAEGPGVPPRAMTGIATAARGRAEVAVEELEVAAYTIPTDAPEADGTARVGCDHDRRRARARRRRVRARLHVRRCLDREADRVEAGRDRPRPRRDVAAGGVGGDGRADPEPRPARDHARWRSPRSTSRCGT